MNARLILAIIILLAASTNASESSKYLDAVREFADNVLKYGRDTYGPKHTPLFVDGINIHTHEPVTWIAPDGERWILSNLASQQNLFRTLDALSTITGDPKYRQAAMEAIEYAFEHLRSPNGLLYWGGHTAYDLMRDKPCGRLDCHELKSHYPYYELMWRVNPDATREFIESFWSAHILDWSNLDMNRHGPMNEALEKPWKHEYKGGPIFLGSQGRSFMCTGDDLMYAAVWLAEHCENKEPIVWAKRLGHKYIRTRHPKTGISYWMYTKPVLKVRDSYDEIMRKLVPGEEKFLSGEFPWYFLINPISRKCSMGAYTPTPGVSVHRQIFEWQAYFLIGEMLGKKGNLFRQWALEELTAFGKASYRKEDNVYVPILTDGTNLEGYVVKEDGPLGPKGVTLEPLPAGASDFWAYAMAYRVTGDEFMWEMSRSIAKGNDFGEIGVTLQAEPGLNIKTHCSNPYALLGFLELFKKTGKNAFLQMAEKIGDNILDDRYYEEFFVVSKQHIYTKFDAVDSLALLRLHSVFIGETATMLRAWPRMPSLEVPYRKRDIVKDNQIIYTLIESPEPPMSLQEAAAIGNVDLVKTIIGKGVKVDAKEDGFLKTALHRAAMSGHRDIAGLLIDRGADIDARDSFEASSLHYASERGHMEIAKLLIDKGAGVNAINNAGDTPLHYAARTGHKDIAESLIAKGANVNAKNNDGQTPLDIAGSRGHEEVVRLLFENGGVISTLHQAVVAGDLEKIKSFIEEGADANAKHEGGSTPLVIAISGGNIDIAKLLIDKGAEVNESTERGWTLLHKVVNQGKREIAELLIVSGADVNAGDKWGQTPLEAACWAGHPDIAGLLIDKGADVNSKDEWGYTPLHYAAWEQDLSLVKLLVEHGAKFDIKDQDGWTAFRYAVSQGNQDIVELFIETGIDASGIHRAACAGDLTSVKRHLDKGVEVDIQDELGWTPLYWAASMDREDAVEYLLSKGANVNAEANDNSTALHQAANAGSTGTVRLLLAEGADINAVDKQGCTPLHNAVSSGNGRLVELLLAKEAAVNVQNRNGWTPLHRAAFSGHKDIIETLLAAGANTAIRGKRGNTALDLARLRNNKEIVELLSNYSDATNKPSVSSAAINKTTYYYRMPLHQAAEEADLRKLEYLIDNQADVNAESTHGWTALHRAAVAGNAEAAEFLLSRAAEPDTHNRWGWSPLHSACLYGHKALAELLIANGADTKAKTPEEETPLQIAAQRGYPEIAELLKESLAQEEPSSREALLPRTRMPMRSWQRFCLP